MPLSVRPTPYLIPNYSLTGDLLAYLNCGLQYRYTQRGALPPSKPVQRWFGEFIHGVMEEAYRQWAETQVDFPWDDSITLLIENMIIQRLAARGIWPRNPIICDLRARRNGSTVDDLAHRRASSSINTWGPHLFPLIAMAEVRLKGIRSMPRAIPNARADYYEVQGIVDVLTSVELSSASANNRLLTALQRDPMIARALGQVIAQANNSSSPVCEVVVDYKGMRRPSTDDPTWEHLGWQIHTYSWLRQQQPGASQVIGGVLLFLNELEPSREDMSKLRQEVFGPQAPQTDVVPIGGDLIALRSWNPNQRNSVPPVLSLEYRISRSIRVIPVTRAEVDNSLRSFDQTVELIEASIVQEKSGQLLTNSWENRQNIRPNPDDQTCAVCDFRTYCPASPRRGAPLAP